MGCISRQLHRAAPALALSGALCLRTPLPCLPVQRRKLFPIWLVGMDAIKGWKCFDADPDKDLAREVREYYISRPKGPFSGAWVAGRLQTAEMLCFLTNAVRQRLYVHTLPKGGT